jgi:hypothetical protein
VGALSFVNVEEVPATANGLVEMEEFAQLSGPLQTGSKFQAAVKMEMDSSTKHCQLQFYHDNDDDQWPR